MVSGLVMAFVVAFEVVVLWCVRGESLVVRLVHVRRAVLNMLMPLDRSVMHGHFISGFVVLLVVHGNVMRIFFGDNFVMWLKVMELLLVERHVMRVVGFGHMCFPVLSMLITSMVTMVGNTLVVRLVVLTVVRTVVLTLTVVVLGGGNSGNSSEGE